MTEEERKKAYKAFVDAWGKEAQIKMAIEEMAELTKELCKSWRDKAKENPEESRKCIAEEIADVKNMISQMAYIFSSHEEIEKIRDEKLARTLKRL